MAVDLIGRDAQKAQVIERLARRRLVSLIGPAGIGKTALARAVAGEVGDRFARGALVVDLTRVDTADAVADTLAGQLGFPSFDDLLSSPGDQPALVVIDNCEHVTAAAAEAVGALLEACHAPTVLATSRSPLDLPGESLVVLGPLEVPAAGVADAGSDAVRLFLERARDHGALVADEQLEYVAELCRRLDGVPLAIELAAARTRTMQPSEILARLGEGIDVLSRPRFRGDPRHRSLAATIEWSYRLLPPEAARLLDRLGLFAGPFTAEMAEAVGADAGLTPMAASDALALLVDSSLVVAEPGPDATRFRLLETVRTFAVGRLVARGQHDEARDRLAGHVVDAVADQMPATTGRRWDAASLNRLLALYDNVVASLRWALSRDDPKRGLALAAALWGVVHQGHSDEIATLSRQAIDKWPDPDLPHAADAVATAATATYLVGDPAGALEMAQRALPTAGSSLSAPVTLRRAMGYAATALGDHAAAIQHYAETAREARERGLTAMALEVDVNRALLLAADGDVAGGLELARRSRAAAAEAQSPVAEEWALSAVGFLELIGDVGTGLETVTKALAAAREMRFPGAIGVNLRSLAWGLTRISQHRRAAETLLELFDSLSARGRVADVRGALLTTAELLFAIDREAWRQLAATAQSLPYVGPLGGVMDSLVDLPSPDAAPLDRRDAVILARSELRELLSAPAASALPVPTEPAAGVAAFIDRGEYWEVSFARRTIHAKTSKGLADLRRLLASPGREINCLELMGAGVEQSSTGEVLDATARRQYEHRVRELQAEIDSADADNDYHRAERARLELDALVDQLTSAMGLGGRSRRSGGTAERARSAVTQRIRATIRRLGAAHPELGRHLEASIVTGTYCVYRPEHPVEWKLA